MLEESCLCWGNCLNRPTLLDKELLSDIVNCLLRAGFAIQKYNVTYDVCATDVSVLVFYINVPLLYFFFFQLAANFIGSQLHIIHHYLYCGPFYLAVFNFFVIWRNKVSNLESYYFYSRNSAYIVIQS